MAFADQPKRPDGLARARAREAVEREMAARELQEKLRRIEVLRTLVDARFGRLNRAIIFAVFWTGVLAAAFVAFAWYSVEITDLLAEFFGSLG